MDKVPSVAFGTLLRRYRVAAGLTQEELAERAGISLRSLGDMEREVAHTPRQDTVALLAAALALSPQESMAFAEAARRLRAADPTVPAHADASTPPFVGRARDLALLERHVTGQGPPLLLVAGEPGIGKTRLLHAAIPRALMQGLHVLEGGCQRRGGHAPYAPLLDALQRHLRDRRPAQLRADLRDCAWLVRLLPELAGGPIAPLPAWTPPPDQERRLMFEAVVRFLGNVAGPAGTLLVLDDLQWAGPDALDLLATLVRAAAEVPLRVLGAYRDTEVQPHEPLSVLLADLAHAGLAARRLLAPLEREEAAHLLDDLLANVGDADTVLRERVLERAGGVPFFLVSCAQGLGSHGLGWGGDGHAGQDDVPWDVAQSIRTRVAALPEGAGEVLGVAAVLGRVVQPAVLAAVVAHGERAVLAALDAAGRTRLLEEAGAECYQFAHDVIREVVEADLGAARRMVLHRAIAEALAARTEEPPVEELAYHHAHSDHPERALPHLVEAAERARMAAAYQEAAAALAQAIELAQQVGRDDLVGDLHARRGKALFALTRWAEARREMEAALERVAPEQGDQRAEILADLALASHWVSDAAATRRYASEALAEAEGLGREDLAIGALSALVLADSSDGALQAGLDRYRQAAARAGDRYPAPLAPGVEMASLLLYWLGNFDEAIIRARQAVTLGRAVHDTSTVARALGNLGCALMGSGRYSEALRVFTEVQQFSREVGAVNWLARSTSMRGGLHLEVCDFSAAEVLAEEARELSRSAKWIHAVVSGGIDLLLAFTRSGEIGRAEALAPEVAAGVAQGQGAHGWLWKLRFAQAQAEIALARGKYEHALQWAEDATMRGRTLGRVKYEVAGLQARAQALAALGRRREAIVNLQSAVERASGTGDPAMFLRAAAALLTIDGTDVLLAEARAAVERIIGALPDVEMSRRFQEAEPVRVIVRLATI